MRKAWQAVEHQVFRQLKPLGLRGRTLVLAVSGGPDSMALLYMFYRLGSALGVNLTVAHFHHGRNAKQPLQTRYRERAQKWVKKQAQILGLKFVTNQPSEDLGWRSEAELRKARYDFLRGPSFPATAILVTAHHAQDLLETRLINLLRGTGLEGLRSLKFQNIQLRTLRPFLGLELTDLRDYLRSLKVRSVKDPSNADTKLLRNWLRKRWLPELESFRNGAVKSLGRSLELLSHSTNGEPLSRSVVVNGQLNRQKYLKLHPGLRPRTVVELFRQNQIRSYTKAHVDEFLKRLDTPRKELKFTLLRLDWIADAERVSVSRVGTRN